MFYIAPQQLNCSAAILQHALSHPFVATHTLSLPRYASQVSSKLSCFWALSPVGRPRSIIGILNSLDMKDSLAATGMPLSQVGARGG